MIRTPNRCSTPLPPSAPDTLAKRDATRIRIAGLALIAILLCACDGFPADSSNHPSTARTAEPQPRGIVATARGRVDIEGGVIRLAARRDGVIAEVLVQEGQSVRAGQLLARLDDTTAQRSLALARSETEEARNHLRRAEIERIASMREAARLQSLADARSIARQEYDRARDAAALAATAADAARAALGSARARESVAAREIEERRIVAPMDGRIVQRSAHPGNGVSTLNVTPLFLFVPEAPQIVRAELEEQDLPAIRAGQLADIVLDADAAQRWPARVLRIGRLVGQRTPSEDPAERVDTRVVEVVLTLEPPNASTAQTPLIGQRVIVRFLRG
jgi:RND family efflux transporter MFP subunit